MLNLKKLLTLMVGDTEWKELVSGVTYRKRMGYVTLKMYINSSLSTSWKKVGTLPADYAPSELVYFSCTTVTNSVNIIGSVEETGDVSLRIPTGASSATYSVEGTVTFPLGGV